MEVEGAGFSPLHIPFSLLFSEHAYYLEAPDRSPQAVGGVVRLSKDEGQIWLVCTPSITKYPKHFIKWGYKWLNGIEQDYKLLWNLADVRNKVHHRVLKHFGFKALRTVPNGPECLPYFEIVKLCA